MQGDKICNFTLFFKNSNFPKAEVQQWSDGWLLTPDLYLLWFVFILFAKLAGFSPFTLLPLESYYCALSCNSNITINSQSPGWRCSRAGQE